MFSLITNELETDARVFSREINSFLVIL